jgi:hypothetical protein
LLSSKYLQYNWIDAIRLTILHTKNNERKLSLTVVSMNSM